jgi:hypothetical protein
LKPEGSDSFARTLAKRVDSKFFCFSRGMSLEHLLAKRIKLPCIHVGFELPVPRLSVESSEPLSKLCQLFGREILDLLLDPFNLTHGSSVARRFTGGQREVDKVGDETGDMIGG